MFTDSTLSLIDAYRRLHFALLVVLLMAFSHVPTASADEIRPALLKLSELAGGRWRVTFKQPQVNGRFLNLQPVTNCRAGEITAAVSDTALQESFVLYCGKETLQTVQVGRLDSTLIDVLVTITHADRGVDNHIISANQPILDLSQSAASVPMYLLLGVEHLIFGLDHVLFVLVLLYLVVGFQNLVKVITSFTVAHSITLGLSGIRRINHVILQFHEYRSQRCTAQTSSFLRNLTIFSFQRGTGYRNTRPDL